MSGMAGNAIRQQESVGKWTPISKQSRQISHFEKLPQTRLKMMKKNHTFREKKMAHRNEYRILELLKIPSYTKA